MDSKTQSFESLAKRRNIDYMRVGIICYFVVSVVFLYVYLNG